MRNQFAFELQKLQKEDFKPDSKGIFTQTQSQLIFENILQNASIRKDNLLSEDVDFYNEEQQPRFFNFLNQHNIQGFVFGKPANEEALKHAI